MTSNRKRSRWQLFFVLGALLTVNSCSEDGSTRAGTDDEPGALSGELAMYTAQLPDGTSETIYVLQSAAGEEFRLIFEQEPQVTTGMQLQVWGDADADALRVHKFKVLSASSSENATAVSLPLINPPQQPTRVVCPVIVHTSGNGGNITVAQAEAQFHTAANSVNAHFRQNSYGARSIIGNTYGPFNYPMTTCDWPGLANALRPLIPAADGCQHYAWIMTPRVSACGWAVLGAIGTPENPAKDGWYNNTISCGAIMKPTAYNMGSQNSSSINCGGTGITDSLASCVHSEYGDRFDVMGSGCRHFNAWQKLYQKWWGGCNAVKVTASGDFNLYPTELPCNGVQALQIPFPGGKQRTFQDETTTSWYLEYRTSTGFDSGMTPQVLVHIGSNPVLPNQVNARGKRTWLVNASGSSSNPGLTAGQSISDPAGGLTMTVTSLDATKAVIHVTYTGGSGSPVCLDGLNTPFQPPGPATCSALP